MFEQPVLATEWFAWEVAKADDTTVRSMGSWARSRIPQFTLSLEGITSLPAVTFSGGEDGPAVDETLDALRSVSSAAGFVDRYRKAVKDCDAVTYSVPGVGTSTLHARAISFDDMGDDSFAGRSGALDGFEVIQVGVQSRTSCSACPSSGRTPRTPKTPPPSLSTRRRKPSGPAPTGNPLPV